MTRPRSTYTYADQTARSAARTHTLCADPDGRVMVTGPGRARWSAPRRVPVKQLFVSDEGGAVVLGSDDRLTFHDPRGAVVATVALLDLVRPALLSFGTAGRVWDDTLAGVFAGHRFVIDGRGAAFVFRADGTLTDDDPAPLLRAPARVQLSDCIQALRERNAGWREPWALAAIGWARVAGLRGVNAATELEALGSLPMRIHATTHAGGGVARAAGDPVRLRRWALDPVRQAAHLALVRLGRRAALTTLELTRELDGRAQAWTPDRPADWTEHLDRIAIGTLPGALVARHGSPTHVAAGDAIVWRYAWCRDGDAVTTDVRWDERGVAEAVTRRLPAPTPRSFVA